jgi:hypothetical protein
MIELVSPLGFPRTEGEARPRHLETLNHRRVGFIWNQYPVTKGFWPKLEAALGALCNPASVERAYKGNTWMPLEKEKFDAIAGSVDYLVIGVGA